MSGPDTVVVVKRKKTESFLGFVRNSETLIVQIRSSEGMETSISTRPKPIASKVVLIGDAAVGKTAIRNRFLSGQFTASYKATIGADFFTKTIDIKGQQVSMQIWDTAGQERFRSLYDSPLSISGELYTHAREQRCRFLQRCR